MNERPSQQGEEPPQAEADSRQADQRGAEAAPEEKSVRLSYAEYEELKTLARERDDYLRRLQRAVADYQNLQKRIDRFKEAARQEILQTLAAEILPMADHLELALEAARRAEGAEDIVAGLDLVQKEFYAALDTLNIRPVEAVGQAFDPHYHEAAMQEPNDALPPNTVVRELKKGFVMGDQVIRPSQVVVTAGPAEASPGSEGEKSD